MRPFLPVCVTACATLYLSAGCPIRSDPPPAEPAPLGVAPLALVRSPDYYAGKKVRVMLGAKSYRVQSPGLHWEDGHPHLPPLAFDCPDYRGTGAEPLDVVGTCRGAVGGVVCVSDCVVRVIPRRP